MRSDHVVSATDFVKDISMMSLTGPINIQAVLTDDEELVDDIAAGFVELNDEYFVALRTTVDELNQARQLADTLLEGKVAVIAMNNSSSELIKQQLHSLVNDNQLQFVDPLHGLVVEAIFPPGAGVLLCCTDEYLQTSGLEGIISMIERM